MNNYLQGIDFIRSFNQSFANITTFYLTSLFTSNNPLYLATIFNISNSTLFLASLTLGLIKSLIIFRYQNDFRLNAQSLIISKKNCIVSLINSIFTNTNFNNTMIDLSFFQNIYIENISFINTFFSSCGLKIYDGDASNIIMNSIRFSNLDLNDSSFAFDSIDSILIIKDLEFLSLNISKSIKIITNIKSYILLRFNQDK